MGEKNTPNTPTRQGGFDRFAKEDLWAMSSFKKFLFEDYPGPLNPTPPMAEAILQYDRYVRHSEHLVLELDRHLKASIEAGNIKESKKFRADKAFARVDEPLYQSQGLLKEIQFRGYPVPKGLIEAKEQGDWAKAEKLLKRLHENMKVFVKRDGRIEKDEFEKLVKSDDKPRTQGFPPHQLKDWSHVKFCALIEKVTLEVDVDGESFSVSELTENGLSKANLALLYNIVLENGNFDKDSSKRYKNISLYVKRLNISLKKIFKTNQSPISYNQKAKGYKAHFQTETDSSG